MPKISWFHVELTNHGDIEVGASTGCELLLNVTGPKGGDMAYVAIPYEYMDYFIEHITQVSKDIHEWREYYESHKVKHNA